MYKRFYGGLAGALFLHSPLSLAEPPLPPGELKGKEEGAPLPNSDADSQRARSEKEQGHRGFFGRAQLGLGVGRIWGGDLKPVPGFKPVYDLSHVAPAFALNGHLGYGRNDIAFSVEGLFETLMSELEDPSTVNFYLLGLGLAGHLYSEDDFHLGAALRWVGLVVWRDDVPCFWDRGDWTSGPGLGLTLGKEWFGNNDSAVGLALQANYARLRGVPDLHYASAQVALTLTHF